MQQSPYRSFEAEPIDRCNSHSRYTSHLVLTLDMTHPPKLSPSTMLETLQSTLNHYSPLLTQSIIECIYHYFISLNPGDYLNYKKCQRQRPAFRVYKTNNNLRQRLRQRQRLRRRQRVHLQNEQQLNEHDTAADAAAGSCGNQTNSPNGYSKLLERSMPRCRVSHSVNSN
uniref:Uncharacterized protein n=1 Tax=Brassica campestris TaxID=3711 RepID=M4E4Q4_BRACM